MAITINKTKIKYYFLYFLIFCRYLLPYIFMDNTVGFISKIPILDYSLLAISTFLMAVQVIFCGYRPSRTDVLLIIVYGCLVLSTILNHAEITACLINAFQVILICFTIKCALNNETKIVILLRLIRDISLVIFIANIITTVIYPDGIPSITKLEDTPFFLYGNVNTTVKFIFPGLLCSILLDEKKQKRLSLLSIFFCVGYVYLCVCVYFMATGMFAVLVAILWYLNKKIIAKNTRLICTVVISVLVVFELAIVVFNNQELSNGIASMLGKESGFTGRDYLWYSCIQNIKLRPVLGHGVLNSLRLERMIGNQSGAHNYYLDTLFQRGVVGVVPLLLFLIAPLFLTGQRTYSKERYILIGFAIAYLIMFMFEPFYAVERFHIPVFYVLNLLTEHVPFNTTGRSGRRISLEPVPSDAFVGKGVMAGD